MSGARVLVLGGTSFVGRHVVEAALERDIEVTLFNRGLTNPDLFPGCERRIGDRSTGDLAALASGEWDGVIDVCGYLPREVRATAELLLERTGHYTFVSSIGAHVLATSGPMDEDSLLQPSGDPDDAPPTDIVAYGPRKVRCEQIVRDLYGDRAAIVRPSLVVGPNDPTDGFTYWVRRAAAGGEMLVPDRPDQPVQFVHARDQGAFMVELTVRSTPGVFTSVGPNEPCTLAGLLETIGGVAGADLEVVWADEQFLQDHGAAFPIPVYWPTAMGGDGVNLFSTARATAAGLRNRPPSATVEDTLAWDRTRDQRVPLGDGTWLTAQRERELLDAWRRRGADPATAS
jgi:2'-hydroxyisoflavone reductase